MFLLFVFCIYQLLFTTFPSRSPICYEVMIISTLIFPNLQVITFIVNVLSHWKGVNIPYTVHWSDILHFCKKNLFLSVPCLEIDHSPSVDMAYLYSYIPRLQIQNSERHWLREWKYAWANILCFDDPLLTTNDRLSHPACMKV